MTALGIGLALPFVATLGAGVGGDLLQRILSPAGEDYAYFDFTQTDRLFQENVGPTPADGTGEAIGLVIGRNKQGNKTLAQVMDEQSNSLVPGAWTVSTAGGTATATESPSGTLNITGDGTNAARADQSFATEVGKIYQIRATTTSSIAINVGTSVGGGQIFSSLFSGAADTRAFYFVATTTTTHVRFYKSGAEMAVLTAISARYVPAHYAFQSVTNFKPQLQPFYTPKAGVPELIPNGTFDANINGWVQMFGAVTWQSPGKIRGVASGTTPGRGTLQINNLEIGRTYILTGSTTLSGISTMNFGMSTTQGVGGLVGNDNAANKPFRKVVFTATATTMHVLLDTGSNTAGVYWEADNLSLKEANTSIGAMFDGSDDTLLSDWLAQAGENCIIAQVEVPATLASTQYIAGCGDAGSTNRLYVGFDTAGLLVGGAGLTGSSVIKGGSDKRGATVTVAISLSADTVRLLSDEGAVYTAARSGDPSTTTPLAIGAWRAATSYGQFFGGSIKRLAFGKKAITLAQFQQIAADWAA